MNNIYGMVFDTTSCNTGHLLGACVTFQKWLRKSIFWLACRHHVLELLLDNFFCSLAIEKLKTHEVEVFKRFKKHYNEIWQQFDGELVNLVVTSENRQKF